MKVARLAVAACAFGIAAAGAKAAPACGEALAGSRTTIEGTSYTVAYTTTPSPVTVGQHFRVDFAVCPRDGVAAPRSVRVDATMPEHRHGMNYRPTVSTVQPGLWRAEGLLFHMPGRWDLAFDVVAPAATQRLTATMRVE